MPNALLSQAQVEQFIDSGYLVLPEFASSEWVDTLRGRMDSLLQQFDPTAHQSTFIGNNEAASDRYFLESGNDVRFFLEPDALDDQGQLRVPKQACVNKAGHALHVLDPVYREATAQLKIPQLAAALGQQMPTPLQSMYLFKQPRIGAPVALHQDATFLFTDPVSVMGFWLALDDATEENGCLWALPGGHTLGLKRRMRRSGESTRMEILDDQPFPDSPLTALPVPRGSLIILHGLLPHLSYANQSDQPRHAYSLHLVDGAAQFPSDNWLTMPATGTIQ
ncbi:MAG: phytanoyl-CoA dioxygenase family protein [Lysobacterales bacterium]